MGSTLIVYYTGTGSTALVADEVKKNLVNRGKSVEMHRLTESTKEAVLQKAKTSTELILIYAVHAFNAPDVVYKWLRLLDDRPTTEREKKKAMVLSVSGGGEMVTNTACRVTAKRLLDKKGYNVVTEAMAVMPNSWMSPTPMPISKALISILPEKVDEWMTAYTNNQPIPYMKTKPIDRLITKLGRLEVKGAVQFGKNIRVNEKCNGCGWCERHCPAENINLSQIEGAAFATPEFSNVCDMCLGCVYGCPQNALAPGKLKFAVIKDGYPLEAYKQPSEDALYNPALTTILESGSWKGVRRYLGV